MRFSKADRPVDWSSRGRGGASPTGINVVLYSMLLTYPTTDGENSGFICISRLYRMDFMEQSNKLGSMKPYYNVNICKAFKQLDFPGLLLVFLLVLSHFYLFCFF